MAQIGLAAPALDVAPLKDHVRRRSRSGCGLSRGVPEAKARAPLVREQGVVPPDDMERAEIAARRDLRDGVVIVEAEFRVGLVRRRQLVIGECMESVALVGTLVV